LIGGAAATAVLHPLDLLKTRQAVHGNGACDVKRRAYASVSRAFADAVGRNGVRGLYSGVGANVALAGTSWGVYFMTYGVMKNHFGPGNGQQAAAAVGAGTATVLVSSPLSVVRTRLVMAEKNSASALAVLARVIRAEGVGALYKGLAPSLLNVSHGSAQFVAYEFIKNKIRESKKKEALVR